MKRVVYAFFALIFLIFSVIIPDFSSFATVVVPADDNLHFYILNHYDTETWSAEDFLTKQNYDLYYDALSGTEKTDIINKFVDTENTSNNRYSAMINDFTNPEYTTQAGITITNMYALPPIYNNQVVDFDDCEILIIGLQNGSTNPFAIYCFYSPTGDDIIISGNTVISTSPYLLTYQPYNWYRDTSFDGSTHLYYVAGSPERFTIDTLNTTYNIYASTINVNVYDGCIFSTIPYLFTSNTLNGLNNDFESYQSYVNGVSYAIDRRTEEFYNKVNGITPSTGSLGVLEGSYNHLFNGVSYTDCNLFISYQLNNYTKSLGDSVHLNLDYRVDFEGSYDGITFDYDKSFYDSLGGYDQYYLNRSNLIQVDMSKVFSMINTNATNTATNSAINQIVQQIGNSTIATYQCYTAKQFFDVILRSGGFKITQDFQHVSNFWEDLNDATWSALDYVFKSGYSFYATGNNNSVFDHAYLYITEFLEDANGNTSDTLVWCYDFLTGSMSEVGGFEVNGEGETFTGLPSNNFATGTDLNNTAGGYSITGGSSAYGGTSSATGNVVNVYPGLSSIPYVLVDIPENEWLDKTPRLKDALNDFKDMLAETRENSILTLLPATYSYFPAPVWSYLLYAVGICLMIGIWRGITRR